MMRSRFCHSLKPIWRQAICRFSAMSALLDVLLETDVLVPGAVQKHLLAFFYFRY